jgi:hypothetical protein
MYSVIRSAGTSDFVDWLMAQRYAIRVNLRAGRCVRLPA